MSSKKDTTYYMELQTGDAVQEGDQFRDVDGQWKPYTFLAHMGGKVGFGVTARRPITATGQVTYEEVPGSRTTQQAIDQPQRERIAYEELQPGDVIQEGDEFRNADGRWHAYDASLCGSRVHGAWDGRARRPYKIGTILEIGDALANAEKAATQLQDERDKAQLAIAQVKAEFNNQAEVLAEVRADEKRLFEDLELLRSEYATVQQERDLARSEVARLSAELWARKPLEERVASLTDELANARENIQKLVKTIADNADQFAEHTKLLVHERDEARAEVQRLQEVVRTLHSEPMAWQVQQMLGTWITELNWSVGCFGSFGRAQVDIIQQTMTAVIQRIETMIHPEGNTNRDEARAEVQRLQEVVRTLHSEPMAWQVQQMLGTWITAIDWSAGCFDSAGREQIDTIQKTLIAVMERIGILNPEGNTDGE